MIYDTSQTILERGEEVENKMGFSGSFLAHYFIHEWFGVGSFLLVPVIFMLGLSIFSGKVLQNQIRFSKAAIFSCIWISLLLGFIASSSDNSQGLLFICGATGFKIAYLLNSFLGWATFLVLGLILVCLLYTSPSPRDA